MGRKFTKIPENTFKQLAIGAGVLAKTFDPETGTLENSNILGATTGGISFSDTPTYRDDGADIDNCPKNTMELKQLDYREIKLSATTVTATPEFAKVLIGAADLAAPSGKITPRDILKTTDFLTDLWLVCDYSDTDGGMIAIHLKNVLNTDGFQIQTVDKDKGKFAIGMTAHYSIAAQDTVPYEVYIKDGSKAA